MQFGRKSEKLQRRSNSWSCDWKIWCKHKRRRASRRRTAHGVQPRMLLRTRNPRGGRCPATCRESRVPMCRKSKPVRDAAGNCVRWAKTSRRCWSMCRHTFMLSGMYGRS
jgi:hypothetical protein